MCIRDRHNDIGRTMVNCKFEVTTTFDPRLDIDASMFDVAHMQSEFDSKNPEFAPYTTVTDVSFDPDSGKCVIKYDLDAPGRKLVEWDDNGSMDSTVSTLKFDTPLGAINLPASDFTTLVGANSLDLIDSSLNGYIIVNGNPDEGLYTQNLCRINVPYPAGQVHLNLTMRNPESKPALLRVSKTVAGDAGFDAQKDFLFTLTSNGQPYNGNYMVQGTMASTTDGVFALKDGESAVFEFAEGDQFNLTENDYSADGYTVEYIGETSGNISLHQPPISVVNTYTAPTPVNVDLDSSTFSGVLKNLTGTLPDDFSETFRASITPIADAPAPKSSQATVTMNHAGDSSFTGFGAISFTKAGKYTYRVDEIPGTTEGMTYDPDGDTLNITVTEVNGVLNADITKKAVIENTYKTTNSQGIETTTSGGKTGDATNIWMFLMLAIIAGGVIVCMVVFQKKRGKNK